MSVPVPILVVAFGGRVFGVHAQTGQHLWRHQLSSMYVTRAEVHGDRVYVVGDEVHCLDYATGQLLWTGELTKRMSGAVVLTVANFVFVGQAGAVVCFAADDGRRLWEDSFEGEGLGAVAFALPGMSVQADRH